MSFAIIGVLAAAAGIIIALAAIILYKRHLNRVVSGEEHDLHSKTAEPGTVLRTVVICVLGIWLIISMGNIASLKTELQHMTQQTINQYNNLSREISELRAQIDSVNSITDNYSFGFTELDSESMSVAMELSITLKEYSNDSKAFVSFGETTAELKCSGGVFSGKLPLELFGLYENAPILTVETNGVFRTQVLDQCPSGYIGEYVLPSIMEIGDDCSFEFDYNDNKGNLIVSGTMSVLKNDAKIEGISLLSSVISFELDGKTVKELPLSFSDDTADGVDLSSSFPAQKDQTLSICLKSTTDAGWTIRQEIYSCRCEDDITRTSSGDIHVTDSNGRVLLQIETDTY